jgi:N-acyl-D-amino-acid deacylase
MIDRGREEGLELYVDTISYTYGSMGLHSMLPEWCMRDSIDEILAKLRDPVTRSAIKKDVSDDRVMGLARNTLLVAPRNQDLVGKTFEEIASIKGEELIDVALDLMVEEDMVIKSLGFGWPEDWLIPVMQYDYAFIESDAGSLSPEGVLKVRADARGFGTFPRFLGYFVREKNVLPLEQAVRKITSLPAQAARIKNRGLLKKGMHADIVVFDPEKISERATPVEPIQYPEGIEHVVVNGTFVVRGGETTGASPGRVIRL